MQADEELWSAIADPSRRQVLDLLVSHGAVSNAATRNASAPVYRTVSSASASPPRANSHGLRSDR